MHLSDIVDTNPTAKKMRQAVTRGKVSQKAKELTKDKAADSRNSANYNSGVNGHNDDAPINDSTMGGGEDFSQ